MKIDLRRLYGGICILILVFISLVPAGLSDLIIYTYPEYFNSSLISQPAHEKNLTTQDFKGINPENEEYLVRIWVNSSISLINLPIFAHLLDVDNYDYVLVKASPVLLNSSGYSYTILDPDARGGTYAIASRYTNQTSQNIAGVATILFDDGKNIILKTDPNATPTLLSAGLEIRWLNTNPMVIQKTATTTLEEEPEITYDPRIADMTSRISRDVLYEVIGSFSGEQPLVVRGMNYTILTRLTDSGEPIDTVTQYAYDSLHRLNMSVSFTDWTLWGYSCRNVIGVKNGTSRSDEIILLTAHLDSFTDSGNAPGADDDASGSVAILSIADILNHYQFERTIIFVLFTGEEQGLLGSMAYANDAAGKGEKIIAVLNLDMIAYNKTDGPVLDIHTRPKNNPGYFSDMRIARTFNKSVDLYGLRSNLTPVIHSDGNPYSDHDSFWYRGFPAVMAIEDINDETPFYHTQNDRRQSLDMEYYTNFVKASIATVAHLAYPIDPSVQLLRADFLSDMTEGTPPLKVQF
ncbi:MAG: M28 family metallopeptidase, partial [Methanobacteriota archaeon]